MISTLGGKPELAMKLASWPDLVDAWLITREGGVANAECLAASKASLGGEILIAATGGSHTSDEVMEFISHCLVGGNAGRVNNSYGSTEFPGISQNGIIGSQLDLELRAVLSETGESIYSPNDQPHPRGEIVVRSKNGQATEYWKRPDLMREAYDSQGWYRTGDVGELRYDHDKVDTEGPLLYVVDRVKNLEEIYWDHDSVWIAATNLEEKIYSKCPAVQKCVLSGDRMQEGLVAVCTASQAFAQDWAGKAGLEVPMLEGSKDFEAAVLAALQVTAAAHPSPPRDWEVPIAAVVIMSPWTEEGGWLTITGKPKRSFIKQHYHSDIAKRYGELTEDSCTINLTYP
jgi:long-subunit acyl-CoA synthetase (AMP-forming)